MSKESEPLFVELVHQNNGWYAFDLMAQELIKMGAKQQERADLFNMIGQTPTQKW